MHKNAATLRCGIYTRKSTEEGLDQEFNSLDAQRESAEAFVRSQKGLVGNSYPPAMTTAVSAAGTWSGRLCGGCSMISTRVASTAWWSTRWTGSAAHYSISHG